MSDVETGLRSLTRDATVRLRSASGDAVWGSGFFVAPGWVLTCAHVLAPHLATDRDALFQVQGEGLAEGRPCDARLEAWLVEEERDPHRPTPLEQDLALVRLVDPPPHTSVWLSDRPAALSSHVHVGGYAHWEDGRSVHWESVVRLVGSVGPYGLRGDRTLAAGVSGGPVFDPVTGGVVGVARARRWDDTAALVSTAALHDFGSLGLRVLADHDRWHASRVPNAPDDWTALQRRLPTGLAVTGDQWSPDDRRAALSLLSALPPAEGARPVAELLRAALGEEPSGAPRLPPRTWRDGHGMLYGHDATPAAVFLRYLRLVVLYAQQTDPGDEAALRLDSWIQERLTQVASVLRALVVAAALPPSLQDPPDRPQAVVPFPVRGDGHPVVTVELEPLHWAMTPRFYWRIVMDDGYGEWAALDEECVGPGVRDSEVVSRLARPLAHAFHMADLPGRPAPLEVALPPDYFDLEVHLWSADDVAQPGRSRTLGEHRSVVLRDLSRRAGRTVQVRERWDGLHSADALTALPARGAEGDPVERWQRSGPGTVPLICQPGGRGVRRRTLEAALDAGYPVALWSTEGRTDSHSADYDELVSGAVGLLGQIRTIRELPDRLRKLRHSSGEATPNTYWGRHLALLYDDPYRPLPTEDFELDAP